MTKSNGNAKNGGSTSKPNNLPEFVYNGDIAISGISGRMPKSENMDEFKENLMSGVDMISSLEELKTMGYNDSSLKCGKMKGLECFDAEFFNLSAKMADNMDPQLRLLLECSYEAFTDAGQTLEGIKGTRCGVFVGVRASETGEYLEVNTDAYSASRQGCSLTMFANRLSYFFDLKGPSAALDTACSSSLVCMEQALMGIRMGIIDSALVAGTNLNCKHSVQVGSGAGGVQMLAPDGACKTFDVRANGYCRSESVMVSFIQKVPDCKRVYATVLHTLSNCDGFKKQGISFPSGLRHQDLYRDIYHLAGIDPNDVEYFECHGTGTKVGDPQEVNGLSEVFCKNRKGPLKIGSIKSNMGHSEPCSGMSSLGKIIIAMETKVIPGNLHYHTPNPEIAALTDGRVKVVSENTPWKGGLVGINNFGFGGSNAHCILRSYDKESKAPHPASKLPRLFVYGGRTEEAVKRVLSEAKKHAHDVNFHSLMEESANTSLRKLPYRGYTVLNNAGAQVEGIERNYPDPREVWFVFAGMGSQWHGMGKKMMQLQEFKNSILRTNKYLIPYNVDMYDLIMNGDEKTFDETIPSFVGITTIQVAIVDLLFAMDLKPDGIVGHSLGELGCGYADGSLTAEEAVLGAYWRGRCVAEATLPAGKMAAVGLSWDDCKRLCPKGVVPACHNSSDTVTISGPYDATVKFLEELKAQGIFVREVKSSNVAFHSYFMQEIAPQLKAALSKVIVPKKRTSRWVSTSIPESRWHEPIAQHSSAEYHVNNLVSPVLFQEGLNKIPKNALVIEIAPHTLMGSILKRSLNSDCVIVGCMKRQHENNVNFFFENVGKAFANSVDVRPLKLFPLVEYPVPAGTPMVSPVVHKVWDHSFAWPVVKPDDFLNMRGHTVYHTIDLSESSPLHNLVDHSVEGRLVFPGSGYPVLAWQSLCKIKGLDYQQTPILIENIRIIKATVLNPAVKTKLRVTILPGTGEFEVVHDDDICAVGYVSIPEGDFMDRDLYPEIAEMERQYLKEECTMTKGEVYKILRLRGYDYGPGFQGIQACHELGKKANLRWDPNWMSFIDTLLHVTGIMDLNSSLLIPTLFKHMRIDPRRFPGPPKDGQDMIVLPAFADLDLRMAACCGLEVQGTDNGIIPRRIQSHLPTLTEHRFVPLMADLPECLAPSLKEYCKGCTDYAINFIKEALSKDIYNFPNRDVLSNVIKSNESSTNVNISKLKELPSSGLIKVLETISNLQLTHRFGAMAEQEIISNQSLLTSDMLLTSLEGVTTLMPALRIDVNGKTDKFSVFEINACQSNLYKRIVPMLKSNLGFKFQYTAVDKSTFDIDTTAFDVKTLEWDPCTASALPSGQANLVILKNFLHKQKDMDKAFQTISSMISKDGCILVEEVTENFALPMIVEALSTNLEVFSNNKGRTYGYFFSESQWNSFFTRHGFEVIYKKSDQVMSTMFLLKQKRESQLTSTLLYLDDLEGSWLPELKSRMKGLESSPKETRLWLVATTQTSGIMGLVTCLAREAGGDKIRYIFVSNLKESSVMPDLNVKGSVFKSIMQKDLVMNIYRDGHWGVFCHIGMSQDLNTREKQVSRAHAHVVARGDLSSLKWIESGIHHNANSQELCKVYYSAINARDVSLATGKIAPNALQLDVSALYCQLGMEFSGRDSTGKRVMGIVPCEGIATEVKPFFSMDIPDSWSMEQAATVPIVYSTVFYSLVIRAGIKKGEKVLIHSGTGSIGQAAISVALSYGCEVFVTVGSDDKKQLLKKLFPQIKDKNICSSKDRYFELHVMRMTGGKGVDIILNTLADEQFQSSIRTIAQHGRFLELGKTDMTNNSKLGMSIFLRNITFHSVLLDSLFDAKHKETWSELTKLMTQGIKNGVVKPLKTTVFDKSELEQAFRYKTQRQHTEKTLIKIRDEEAKKITKPSPFSMSAVGRTYFSPSKSYIIIGGLGGMGLEVMAWLCERGAKKVIMTSRSGVKTGYQARKVNTAMNLGLDTQTLVSTQSCNTLEGARALLKEAGKLGPVGGIFNLAMVLRDGLIENQTKEMFDQSTTPKIKGTINLDKASREMCSDSLDHFVVFSSVACGWGNLGQTNYGFANSVMERICEKRKADNLPGLAIQWGAIGDVGVVAETMADNDTVIGGCLPQRMNSCLNVMDQFMTQDNTIVCTFQQANADEKNEKKKKLTLTEMVAKAIGLKDEFSIGGNVRLDEIGLDSFMGVEIKQMMEREFDISLSTKQIVMFSMNQLRELDQSGGVIPDSIKDFA